MSIGAKRQAQIAITSSSAGMDRGLNDAKRKMRMFARDQVRESAATAKAQARIDRQRAKEAAADRKAISGFAVGIGSSVGSGAASFVIDTAKGVYDFEKSLTALQISGEMSTAQVAEFRAEVMRVSQATGRSATDILAGSSALVSFTGDAKEAQQAMQLMAETAQATGASTEDIAGIMATLDKNTHLPVGEWRAAMDMLVKQAHLGGIEMRDLAGNFARVAAAGSVMFSGGESVAGLAQISAETQVLNNMTHDAATSVTYLKDMYEDLKKAPNVAKMRELGIEPYKIDPKSKAKIEKSSFELLDAIRKKVGNNPELIQKLFPDIRGGGALEYLLKERDAVHSIYDASVDSNQVAKDFAIQQESTAGRVEAAYNRVKLALANAFTPERVEAFAAAVEKVLKFAVETIELIDHFANGETKEERANGIAQGLLDNANRAPLTGVWQRGLTGVDETQQGNENASIHRAQAIIADHLDPDDRKLLSAGAGGLAGAQAGARKFLDSEGMGDSSHAKFADAIATALGNKLNIVLKIDGSTIATAAANSMIARKQASKSK